MSWSDPVVEEVRERGRKLTARFGNDVGRLFRYLRRREAEHPERLVDQIKVVKSSSKRRTV